MTKKTIAFVVYPGMTPLDLVGPLQVMSGMAAADPAYRVVSVGADTSAPTDTDTPLQVTPTHTFGQVTEPSVVVVPGGGMPTLTAMTDENLLDWIRGAARTADLVTSVCTGSLLLGAAGLLEGRRATTHWGFTGLLPRFGAEPVSERWVEDGPLLTAAGVSAGIDMALHLADRLAGEKVARRVQLMLEYDPEPPLGGIDWDSPEIPAFASASDRWLETALAGHPELLERLRGDGGQ